MTANDTEIILMALKKEREIAHQKVMQLDRIIKKIKEGKYLGDDDNEQLLIQSTQDKQPERIAFPKQADIKVQILKVFDLLNVASKLQAIQDEFTKITETNYPIRDNIRSLHNSGKLKMIKERGASRGFLWAKTDWIENGQLLDEYKPEGFDLLYKAENLEYV